MLWPFGARIFGFGRGFGEGAGLNTPVTACLAVALAKAGAETTPKPKKTASFIYLTEWLQHFLIRSNGNCTRHRNRARHRNFYRKSGCRCRPRQKWRISWTAFSSRNADTRNLSSSSSGPGFRYHVHTLHNEIRKSASGENNWRGKNVQAPAA